MKKFLLALTLLCSAVFAQPDDSDFTYWPRSYFASVGFNVIANRGDFFKRTMKVVDKDGFEETVNLPISKLFIAPDYNLGVNVRDFSFTLSFQYWTYLSKIAELPEDKNEQDVRYYRFGFEATYNFFYPEFFQVGIGLGYSFSNLKIEDNVTSEKGFFDSELMGSGLGIITYIRYYITDFFCLSPSLRIYENWYKAVHTDNSGTVEFHDKDISYFWQTYIAVSLNAMVQF
ncbi:hypothetical protein [Fibrobacter sp. UBA4297]|uniref:hypothetical protein n=1 Tax=Fibrobacter sp. UBA4297 TaxID=1946536 RepID=UPI0025C6A808|nr:hypothetical protein [Fibrobacter sp. UBA4297]